MTVGQDDNTKLNLMTEHGRWCIDGEGISAICFSPPVRVGIGHTLYNCTVFLWCLNEPDVKWPYEECYLYSMRGTDDVVGVSTVKYCHWTKYKYIRSQTKFLKINYG